MKRFLLLLVAGFLLLGLSMSCKSYEDCPAYGKAEKKEQEAS
jgi:hypothetical protein